MTTTAAALDPAGLDDADVAPQRRARWPLAVAVLLAAAPFVATAVHVLVTLPGSFQYAGDQAIIGLAAHAASAGEQLLGPYSRYGWAHPGPAWFYLLAPGLRLLGGHDAALVASNLLVHGLLAAAFVAAFWRRRRPAGALLAAGVVLLLVLRLPAGFFLDVWNPFALLLGAAAFLALAARVRDGRWTTLLLLLVAGSYLAQTHVGTAPLVLAVGAVALVAFLVGRRAAPLTGGSAAERSSRWPTVALTGLLVLMWVPPVVQQLTSPLRDGNIGALVHFFVVGQSDLPGPSPMGALTAVGRMLVMTPYGWGPGPFEMDISVLPGSVAFGLAAQVLASVAVLVLGLRWRVPTATWTGVVTLTALGAAVAAALTVSGTMYWYLLTWVTVLPAVTLMGGILLVLGDGPARPRLDGFLSRRPVLAGLALLTTAGGVLTAVSLSSATDQLPASAGVAAVVPSVEDALADADLRQVHVDIRTHDRWPIAAGLIQDLEAQGLTVTVGPSSADLFGQRRVSTGRGEATLILVAPDDPQVDAALESGARELDTVDTENGPITMLLLAGD